MNEHTADELFKKIQLVKTAIDSLKKGIRYTGGKQKSLNISTPHHYEKAEIMKYQT